MDLFRGTYCTASNRKPRIDYASPGRYFVTVCTADCDATFGEIRNGIMGLNDAGCIVADEIERTPMVRPYVAIDDWIVMPDHMHMIVEIRSHHDPAIADGNAIRMERYAPVGIVETSRRDVSSGVMVLIPLCRFRPRSLGAVINHIKSACTKRIRAAGHANFAWQSNYYDRIIRSETEWHRIRRYIETNPRQCKRDTVNRMRK